MVPPWTASHAHEWSTSNGQQRVPPLPSFGKKEEGDDAQDHGTPQYTRVKQEEDVKFESLDDYFCKGMDSSGPASWDKLLREMEKNSLVDVGTMNYREGVREEKRGMLDLKSVQFPKPTTQSVKRAMVEQALVDLKVAWTSHDSSAMLRHLTVLIYFEVQMATSMRLHPYLSSTFLWVHEWQMGKIYEDFEPAESAYEMMQNLTMKKVRDGYVLVNTESRVIGDFILQEKADVVLTIPVENLLVLVPNQIHLPFAGLTGMGHLPLVAEIKKSNDSTEPLVSSPL